MTQPEAFASRIREAATGGRALRLRGGGSKDFYGETSAGDPLDTRGYAGIVDYEPTELVVTARCGTPLADLEAALGERGQMLAFEPPHFKPGLATVGGMVASGLSGPRRAAAGAVRDFVLGVKVMDGQGRALTFGGQVMKNVAGYDVSRLMAGSLGTLALILEVSLKTMPRPLAEDTLALEMDEARAVEALNRWAGRIPLSASAWHAGRLVVRLSGVEPAVRAARESLGGERIGEADGFWRSVRDHRHPFFAAPGRLWRISVPPTAGLPGLAGERLAEWNGALRWLRSDADPGAIREAARSAGGHATLFRAVEGDAARFTPLAAPLMKIHRELKAVFDPQGIFNRGRMYADL